MAPADECFETEKAAGRELVLRLIVNDELAARERLAQGFLLL